MASMLHSGLNRGRGYCVVFLDKTCYSYSASLLQGVQMFFFGKFLVGGATHSWTSIHSGGVELLLVALCYRNEDNLPLAGPHGSYADYQ